MGLKPWEFRKMIPYEYHLCAQGFVLREQIQQIPLRRIWQLLYNVNAKQQIVGGAIASYWPLPDIDLMQSGMDKMDERVEQWAAHQAANRARKERALELKKRQIQQTQ